MINKIPITEKSREMVGLLKLMLNNFKNKKISGNQFNADTARVAIEYAFDEFKPMELPPRIPEMIEYDNLNNNEKRAIDPSFWRQEKVFGYLSLCQSIKVQNQANREWLYKFSTWLPKDDPAQTKIKNRLFDFEGDMTLVNEAKEMFND